MRQFAQFTIGAGAVDMNSPEGLPNNRLLRTRAGAGFHWRPRA